MKKIIISAEELKKIGLAAKKVSEVEFNVIGQKLGGPLIVSFGESCIELPSGIKFETKTPKES